jgi:hypothetical protein
VIEGKAHQGVARPYFSIHECGMRKLGRRDPAGSSFGEALQGRGAFWDWCAEGGGVRQIVGLQAGAKENSNE